LPEGFQFSMAEAGRGCISLSRPGWWGWCWGGKGVFSIAASTEGREWEKQVESLRTFHFDAVTVDGSGADASWPLGALDVASVAFVLWDERMDRSHAYAAGIRWKLLVARALGQTWSWSLDPLQT
jgi:hypothetical protein